jgi:hypothetical protein
MLTEFSKETLGMFDPDNEDVTFFSKRRQVFDSCQGVTSQEGSSHCWLIFLFKSQLAELNLELAVNVMARILWGRWTGYTAVARFSAGQRISKFSTQRISALCRIHE